MIGNPMMPTREPRSPISKVILAPIRRLRDPAIMLPPINPAKNRLTVAAMVRSSKPCARKIAASIVSWLVLLPHNSPMTNRMR